MARYYPPPEPDDNLILEAYQRGQEQLAGLAVPMLRDLANACETKEELVAHFETTLAKVLEKSHQREQLHFAEAVTV